MKLVGTEERALWATAAARALGNVIEETGLGPGTVEQEAEKASILTAAYADAIILKFRARNTSQP